MNKKLLGILFIAAIFNTILTFFLVLEAASLKDDQNTFSFTGLAIEDIQTLDESNPGTGEYALLELVGGMLGDAIGLMIIAIFIAIIPNTATCLISILTLIGLLFQIGKIKKWKLVMGIINLCIAIFLGYIEVVILALFIQMNIPLILITLLCNSALVLGMVYGVVKLIQTVNLPNVSA